MIVDDKSYDIDFNVQHAKMNNELMEDANEWYSIWN